MTAADDDLEHFLTSMQLGEVGRSIPYLIDDVKQQH